MQKQNEQPYEILQAILRQLTAKLRLQ